MSTVDNNHENGKHIDEATSAAQGGTTPKSVPTQTSQAHPIGKSAQAIANQLSLESLRMSQDFPSMARVKKLVTMIPVRKPHGQEFVRAHHDETYRLQTRALQLKDEMGAVYLVAQPLWDALKTVPIVITAAMTLQGTLFLWPARLPEEDRTFSWWDSALEAMSHAREGWVQVASSTSLGGYEIGVPEAQHADPEWPALSFDEMIKIAFKDRFIASQDHPVVRRLRGLSR